MSNIVVSGYYGSKNAGDEAMLAAMIEVLSELDPQTNITVISANPPDTKRRHGVEAVSWLSFSDIWKALRASDLLVSGGGSLLQNVTSRRSLYYYMAIIVLAFLAHRPVMLYAQGIGPIEGFWARTMMRLIGNGVRLITVRDHGSLAELEAMGIHRPKIVETADPVLAINPVAKDMGWQVLQWNGVTDDKPLVGVSYDPKIDRVLDSIGETPAAKLETITADELMAEVRRKWQKRDTLCEKNAALLKELRRRAFQNAELAVGILRKGAPSLEKKN